MIWIPALLSLGKMSVRRQSLAWVSRSRTTLRIAASCSAAVIPSGGRSVTPAWTCFLKPATRTIKNSSKFEPRIARNFTLSNNGLDWSWASSRTRRWNSSRLNSRLIKSLGSFKSKGMISGGETFSSVSAITKFPLQIPDQEDDLIWNDRLVNQLLQTIT